VGVALPFGPDRELPEQHRLPLLSPTPALLRSSPSSLG
jgi:hypothetical protein